MRWKIDIKIYYYCILLLPIQMFISFFTKTLRPRGLGSMIASDSKIGCQP